MSLVTPRSSVKITGIPPRELVPWNGARVANSPSAAPLSAAPRKAVSRSPSRFSAVLVATSVIMPPPAKPDVVRRFVSTWVVPWPPRMSRTTVPSEGRFGFAHAHTYWNGPGCAAATRISSTTSVPSSGAGIVVVSITIVVRKPPWMRSSGKGFAFGKSKLDRAGAVGLDHLDPGADRELAAAGQGQ